MRILAFAVLVAFGLTFCLSALVPIYGDEVGWKILQARLFFDDFVNISLLPQCGPAFTTPTPWFMVPVRALDAWLYGSMTSPLWLRAAGMSHLLIWLALVVGVLHGRLAPGLRGLSLASLLVAFVSLGVLPFMMVLNRPEQMLLMGLTVLYLWPLTVAEPRAGTAEFSRAVLFLLLVVMLFAHHPKSLAFSPLIIVSVLCLVRRRVLRLTALAVAGYFAAASYVYWGERMKCPHDPLLEKGLQTHVVSLSNILTDPLPTIWIMVKNLAWSIKYVGFILFQDAYREDWLPPNDDAMFIGIVVNVLISVVFLLLACIILIWAYAAIRRTWTTLELSKRDGLVLSALLSIAALAMIQTFKNWYEAALVVPLLGVVALTAVPGHLPTWLRPWIKPLGAYLIGVGLVSQVFLWSTFAPHLPTLTRGGYLSAQGLSFSAFGYSDIRKIILQAADLCRIDPGKRSRHLVVDYLTYTALARTFQPYAIKSITGVGGEHVFEQQSADKIIALLARSRSAGIVAGCQGLPSELRSEAKQIGPVCCLASLPPD